VTLRSIRRQTAVVIQETFLFGTTIADGYDSWVGEGGVLLSRGQRQRIALARAILKDPRILILDEATSDVDTETEVLIQQALETVMRGRTTFVIAHRLSTVRNADQLVVLDHGRVVEHGTHESLLVAGGHYRELYQAQFADQETAPAAV
jgi:subfamily B ATP-binding cassette protein MsbA